MLNFDFYVRIIDNYGDIGFALDMAINLHKAKNIFVNLFVSDIQFTKKFFAGKDYNFINIQDLNNLYTKNNIIPSKYIFNFFKNQIPIEHLNKHNFKKLVINFDYLTFDNGFKDFHLKQHYFSNSLNKIIHYVPGCIDGLGGVIVDVNNDKDILKSGDLQISIFTYQKSILKLLSFLKNHKIKVNLFDSQYQAFENVNNIGFLPLEEYYKLLRNCDINFTRGENSFIKSLTYGKITIWDIYKESNNHHLSKLKHYFDFLKNFFDNNFLFENYKNLILNFNNGQDFENQFEILLGDIDYYKTIFQKISSYVCKQNIIKNIEKLL